MGVCDRGETFLCVDFALHVDIDAHDHQVGDGVESAHNVENARVFEGYLFGDLHHEQDDDQVGATCVNNRLSVRHWYWVESDIHL